jgi:hypothetical protein
MKLVNGHVTTPSRSSRDSKVHPVALANKRTSLLFRSFGAKGLSLLQFALYAWISGFFVNAHALGIESTSGTVNYTETKPQHMPETAALFVIAYPDASGKGMPVAVVRLSHPKFPMAFTIGPQDVMSAGQEFPKKIFLSAKLTMRGDALTRPGDITTPLSQIRAATVGEKNVQLNLK